MGGSPEWPWITDTTSLASTFHGQSLLLTSTSRGVLWSFNTGRLLTASICLIGCSVAGGLDAVGTFFGVQLGFGLRTLRDLFGLVIDLGGCFAKAAAMSDSSELTGDAALCASAVFCRTPSAALRPVTSASTSSSGRFGFCAGDSWAGQAVGLDFRLGSCFCRSRPATMGNLFVGETFDAVLSDSRAPNIRRHRKVMRSASFLLSLATFFCSRGLDLAVDFDWALATFLGRGSLAELVPRFLVGAELGRGSPRPFVHPSAWRKAAGSCAGRLACDLAFSEIGLPKSSAVMILDPTLTVLLLLDIGVLPFLREALELAIVNGFCLTTARSSRRVRSNVAT